MNRTDITLAVISFVLFLSAPFLPTYLYKMAFSNVIVPFVLLVALLGALRTSPIGSVTLLLAVMALFIEYRARVISMSIPASTRAPEYEQQLAPAPVIVPTEVHPEPEMPSGAKVYYKPSHDTGSNTFDTVGSSVDHKKVQDSPRLPEDTNKFIIEHGLA
jgi:hypothetical protein